MDDGNIVVFNVWIVGPDTCGLRERLAIAGDISSFQTNEADEVMYCARFVKRDLHQKRRDGLPQSCQVIRRLSVDRLEVIKSVLKFRYNLFWSHLATTKIVGPSS